jgi:hypothetical protein
MSVRAAIGSTRGNTLRVCNDHCTLQSPVLCDRYLRGWFLSALFEITVQGSICKYSARYALRKI